MTLKQAEELVEKKLITEALSRFRSVRKASSVLGVDHATVLRKINK